MKNLIRSKNILSIVLILLITSLVDYAIGQVFFSAGGATMAISAAFMKMDKPTGCNMAGIKTTAYVIDVDDISTFPSVATTPLSPEQVVTYIGDFTLKAGKRWAAMYSTKEMGELMSELDGPTDGKFFRNKGTIFYPSTSPRALGMMTLFKDAEVIVILQEFSGGGQMRVIGTEAVPAHIYGTENTGKAFSDEKGITYSIEAASCKPAMVYEGTVLTTDDDYTYTETDETGTDSQYVSGYEGITGWSKNSYPKLYFDTYDNAGTVTLRAYISDADRTLAQNSVFYVEEGDNTVVESNDSGFGGTLTVTGDITAGNEFYVDVAYTS